MAKVPPKLNFLVSSIAVVETLFATSKKRRNLYKMEIIFKQQIFPTATWRMMNCGVIIANPF